MALVRVSVEAGGGFTGRESEMLMMRARRRNVLAMAESGQEHVR